MGIDFSHTEAHWAYSGFNRFRRALAEHEGIDLDAMEGFRPYNDPTWVGKSWDGVETALKPLLDHSDCDGEITPEDCATVAPRLREVIDAIWPADGVRSYDRQSGLALAEGMEAAAAAGEPLEFC
jgi:hypothetical protein